MATINEKAVEALRIINTLKGQHSARAFFLATRAKKAPVARDRTPLKPDLVEIVPDGIKLTWINPRGANETFTAPWATLTDNLEYTEEL